MEAYQSIGRIRNSFIIIEYNLDVSANWQITFIDIENQEGKNKIREIHCNREPRRIDKKIKIFDEVFKEGNGKLVYENIESKNNRHKNQFELLEDGVFVIEKTSNTNNEYKVHLEDIGIENSTLNKTKDLRTILCFLLFNAIFSLLYYF